MNASEMTNSMIKKNRIFSMKMEKANKNNIISQYNTLNKTERNNCINMLDISKYKDSVENNNKKPMNMREKFHKISLNKFQK